MLCVCTTSGCSVVIVRLTAESAAGSKAPRSSASSACSATNGVGLAGWGYGNGKVLTISSILTGKDVANDDLEKLLKNSVKWSARKRDDGGGKRITGDQTGRHRRKF